MVLIRMSFKWVWRHCATSFTGVCVPREKQVTTLQRQQCLDHRQPEAAQLLVQGSEQAAHLGTLRNGRRQEVN
ncbi:Dimethylmenaquinone methyltransferase [Mycoavidus cysteinexigens]|uniref:Dimethylmenaquinone methyltransferase n=1 Tax=Mycoavidus cysteinexigens TaxID=1553431 RepID=A0A2Z6EUY2_9BURK|nr:Dimethylmenaquinone methyltransferase [Mycoavidus cysteinexigens]GLR02137.1 hypothetical protein GCM10007934_19510 [Mycoavidus cysteinexigens]